MDLNSSSKKGEFILLIDDDIDQRERLKCTLEERYKVFATNSQEAYQNFAKNKEEIWLVILSLSISNYEAIKLLHQIKSSSSDIPRIVLAGAQESKQLVEAITKDLLNKYLPLPVNLDRLLSSVDHLYSIRSDITKAQQEKRSFPRGVPTDLYTINPPGAEIKNISPMGMYFETTKPYLVGDTIHLEFRLPGFKRTISLIGEIIRRESGSLGRQGFAIRFVEITERERDLIFKYIMNQVASQDLKKVQKKFLESDKSEILPFIDPAKIAQILNQAFIKKLSLQVSYRDSPHQYPCLLKQIDIPNKLFQLSPKNILFKGQKGEKFDFFLHMDYESYLFEAEAVSFYGSEIKFEFPKTIYYSERRAKQRYLLHQDASVFIEIPLSYPPGNVLRRQVLDVCSSGLSFLSNIGEWYFLEGTPLKKFRLIADKELIFEESGVVQHVSPVKLKGEDKLKIGVEYWSGPQKKPRSSQEIISARLQRRQPARGKKVISKFKREIKKSLGEGLVCPVKYTNRFQEEIAALYNTSFQGKGDYEAPCVIIVPAYGRTKETTYVLAATLVQNFIHLEEPLAVLRFDYTHAAGESFIPKRYRQPGQEYIDFTMSRAVEDILATVRFAFHNPLFKPSEIIIVAASFSAPMAIRAALKAPESQINYLIFPMGTPDAQELIKNCSGGIDFLGNFRRGIRSNIANILGYLVDMNNFSQDAIEHSLAFLEDTKRDISQLNIPITWLLGKYDGWVNPKRVHTIMNVPSPGPRELIEVPYGHLPTRSEEGREIFQLVTKCIIKYLFNKDIDPIIPSSEILNVMRRREWSRAPKTNIKDIRTYWTDYLLGKEREGLDFDVLKETDAYQDLMKLQIKLLDLKPGITVADVGSGTGNLVEIYAQTSSLSEHPKFVEIDFVEEALNVAKKKHLSLNTKLNISYRLQNLEVSRFAPISRFLKGEYYGIEMLRGKIQGLSDEIVSAVATNYNQNLHLILRGKKIDKRLLSELEEIFTQEEIFAIEDLSRAARFVKGKLILEDIKKDLPEAVKLFHESRYDLLSADHIDFKVLDFAHSNLEMTLKFKDEEFDRIIGSLFISYVFNPEETLLELYRALKPSGRIVLSTMRPDADISKIYMDLIAKVEQPNYVPPNGRDREEFLNLIREFAGSAGTLLRLEEEGTFNFFSKQELTSLLEECGFKEVQVLSSFGNPPQAYIAVGIK